MCNIPHASCGALLPASLARGKPELRTPRSQAHPEFDPPLLMERIAPALRLKGRLSEQQLAEIDAAMARQPADSSLVRKLYRNFLLRRRPTAT